MKVCTKCGIAKELTDFHKNRARPSGLRTDCKVCVTARANEWNRKNPERHLARAMAWNKANPIRLKEIEKERNKRNPNRPMEMYWSDPEKYRIRSRHWKKRNRDKVRAKEIAWQQRNKHLVASYSAARRARKIMATPSWANKFFIEEAYDLAKLRSALKSGGHPTWHVDHIVPLKSALVCGLHVEHNLQVIPGSENCSKNNLIWPDMP